MPIIRPLPPEVASRIAAGEVVERPASVVKELAENSIDAGARAITVEVEEGGRALIAVTDDGFGMDSEDARQSLGRYATSKISHDTDLMNLSTMGFRGEALHAISSVSQLVIETKEKGALEGTRVESEGGKCIKVRAAGCPEGTRVEVRNLFFNTPARQKFLKSPSVEFGHISSELMRIALAHPHISFELWHNSKKVWLHRETCDHRERMRLIVSSDELDALIDLEEKGYGLKVSGWIGEQKLTRASPKDFHVFVNRRPVRDRLLMHGITAGFGEALDRGRYPVAAVFLEVEPGEVDVNVHPTKREVKFSNGPAVHDFLQAAVKKTLDGARTSVTLSEAVHRTVSGEVEGFRCGVEDVVQINLIPERNSGVRVLGQLGQAFILAEGKDGALVMIDQHAAHERLGFDELMRQYGEGRVEQQRLLFPQTIPLSAQESAAYDEVKDALQQAGFDVEPFGGNEVLVKAVPALLGDADIRSMFEKLFDEVSSLGKSAALGEKVKQVFSVVACHGQVRAGDRLGLQEMQRLVDDVMLKHIDSCPHGRPAVIRFGRSEIEKWFKR